LALYALIARAAADTTIPFLEQLFSERFARLSQVSCLASSCALSWIRIRPCYDMVHTVLLLTRTSHYS
jgi:hypothetical protein